MGWFTVSGGVSGVSEAFVSPYHCLLSHCLSGYFVIRFLSHGRLDDRNYAISGVFWPIPSNSVPVSWILPSHFLAVSLSGTGPLWPPWPQKGPMVMNKRGHRPTACP